MARACSTFGKQLKIRRSSISFFRKISSGYFMLTKRLIIINNIVKVCPWVKVNCVSLVQLSAKIAFVIFKRLTGLQLINSFHQTFIRANRTVDK
jgi:hypothetical protein